MGSYNSSCDITGLPISGSAGEQVLLLLYTKDRNSYSEGIQFLGTPVKAKYYDYGDYILQSENPFNRQLAPNFEDMTGIVLLDSNKDDKYFSAQSKRGLNLWEVTNEFLHLFHELILIRPKWALSETNAKYNLANSSVLDWEGSKSSKVALHQSHPEAWQHYLNLLGSCPASYDARAEQIYKWLRDEDLEIAKETCINLSKDENKVYQDFVEKTFLIGVPDALDLVRECFSQRIISRIRTACVYEKAFNTLVNCTKNQIKEKGIEFLYSKLKSWDQDPDYAKHLEKLKQAKLDKDVEKSKISQMMLCMMRKTIVKDKDFKLCSSFAGNPVTTEDAEASKDLILFNENFYHGFKFSSMAENRQYEGIAHIVAQAKATIDVARSVSKNFYKQGKWETYQYNR